MGHSVFPPSNSKTWLMCAYSARNAPPKPPKPPKTQAAADEGKRVHSLFEAAVNGVDWPDGEDHAAENIALGMDYVRQLEPGTRYTELKVKLHPDCDGTTDLFNLPYVGPVVTVLDVKNGKWDVDAYHNTQMLTYAASLLHVGNYEWWRLVIFQPNGLDENPFKQWMVHRSEIEAHKARALAAINDRSNTPNPGPHCRWCDTFSQCPAMVGDAPFLMAAIARPIESLTTQEILRLVRLIRALGDVKSVYEDALTTHLKMGRMVEGATLEPTRSWRAWNDGIQASAELYRLFGPRGIKAVTPAAAEKLGPAGKAFAAIAAHKPNGELKAKY